MKKLLLLLGVVFCFFSMASQAAARLEIIPSIALREQYNDNIFLSRSDGEDDFITTVSPGIALNYDRGEKLDLALDFGLNLRFYADHSDLNDTDLREALNGTLQSRLRPFNRVFVDIYDRYSRVPVDVRNKIALDNFFTNMTDSNEFRISPYIELPVTPSMTARAGYRYVNRWYRADSGNDTFSNAGFAALIKRLPFGMNVSLNYEYVASRPTLTGDYDSQRVAVSADYQVASNLRIWGGYGKFHLDFEDSDNENVDYWNAGAEYVIEQLGGTSVGASYSRTISETGLTGIDLEGIQGADIIQAYEQNANAITTGVSKRERFDLYLKMQKDYSILINPYYAKDEEIKTSREDRITGVSADIRKALLPGLSVSIDGNWELQKFRPVSRKVRRYSAGAEVDYDVAKNVTAAAGYRYNSRDDEDNAGDYHNNIVWIEGRVTF
jgi:predicted porin